MNLPDPEILSVWWEIDISTHKTDTENLFPLSMSNYFFKLSPAF